MSHVVSGLALTHFSAGYPRRQVIRDLTVPRLQRGKITALLGPNGSGKSTLMRAMAGLGPSAGELSLDADAARRRALAGAGVDYCRSTRRRRNAQPGKSGAGDVAAAPARH